MEKLRKCITLNTGTETRRALREGLGDLPHEWYATKRILLHLRNGEHPMFLHRNTKMDWSGAMVFTRLRDTDQQFCGILYDYFAHEHIPSNDPINNSYPGSAEKISQMLLLAQNNILIPETFIFREESFRRNRDYLKEHLSFPCIFKTDGSKGRNVHYVESWEELEKLVLAKAPHILALAQPFIENEYDTRTIVAYEEVLGSIKRTRTSGYLNNIAQGAIPLKYILTDAESAVAKKASQICGIDVAGVDIIHTDAGPVVIEVNKSPQVRGFESVHGFKVFTKVAEIIRKKSGL